MKHHRRHFEDVSSENAIFDDAKMIQMPKNRIVSRRSAILKNTKIEIL